MSELERVDVVTGQVPLPGMPGDGVLFHVAPAAQLSQDRRRAYRQRQLVKLGRHPLTGSATRPDLGTCGTCAHRQLVGGHAKTYPKCALGPQTSGAATDVRRWWPACARWEAKA